jgi:hypothetical protein
MLRQINYVSKFETNCDKHYFWGRGFEQRSEKNWKFLEFELLWENEHAETISVFFLLSN